MTLMIETVFADGTITLRLVGRIEAASLAELDAEVRRHRGRVVLDLDEVTLVDAAVVRFLVACEDEGVALRQAAPYVRAWMERERARQQ
jgi:anti-anti-sigma regulatory factor